MGFVTLNIFDAGHAVFTKDIIEPPEGGCVGKVEHTGRERYDRDFFEKHPDGKHCGFNIKDGVLGTRL